MKRAKDEEILKELNTCTYAVEHNPNCEAPFLVRLVCPGTEGLDHKPYAGVPSKMMTRDVLGFGKTLVEAANSALTKRKEFCETIRSLAGLGI